MNIRVLITAVFMRVFIKTILMGDESSGGGSTITLQLAKNLFGRNDYGHLSIVVNKLRESIIARTSGGYLFQRKRSSAFTLIPFLLVTILMELRVLQESSSIPPPSNLTWNRLQLWWVP